MAFAHSKPQFDVCNFSCVDSGGLNGWACYCTDGWVPPPESLIQEVEMGIKNLLLGDAVTAGLEMSLRQTLL